MKEHAKGEPSLHIHRDQKIHEICLFIQHRLSEELPLDLLAERAALSPTHFHRVFGGVVGETVAAYIRRLRLERAAAELKTCDRRVLELAMEAGYETHEGFTRAFRRHFGISPSNYRRTLGRPTTSERRPPGHSTPT